MALWDQEFILLFRTSKMFDMFQIQFDPTGEDRIKVRVAFL